MKYYVVSDVHGYYTLLREALEKAGFFDDSEPCRLIVCGDMLDRGDEACRLVDFMVELSENDKLIYILGNHEDLLVKCLHEIASGGIAAIADGASLYSRNKTWDSMLQLAGMSEEEACYAPDELVRRVMRSPFYRQLLISGVDYYETPNYIFTHGWIPCFMSGFGPLLRYQYDPDWRQAGVEAWRRARWYNGMSVACNFGMVEPDKTIVCGHWHTSYGHACIDHSGTEWGENADFSPFYSKGIIAIDGTVAVSGKVNCIVIED